MINFTGKWQLYFLYKFRFLIRYQYASIFKKQIQLKMWEQAQWSVLRYFFTSLKSLRSFVKLALDPGPQEMNADPQPY